MDPLPPFSPDGSDPYGSQLPVPKRGRPVKPIRKTKNAPPPVDIDFTRDPADQILPCTDIEQSNYLGWRVDDVRGINKTLGLYDKLPMICRGEKCFWASQCPTKDTRPAFMFQGLRCPLEVMELFRNFVRLVKELDVHPDDHVDLSQIQDLCRIDLQIKQIDQRLQIQGLEVDHVAAVAQKEGIPFYERIAHPLLAEQGKLREARAKLYKALLVSREQKQKVMAAEQKQQTDILQMMNQLAAKFGTPADRDAIDVTHRLLPLPGDGDLTEDPDLEEIQETDDNEE